MKTYKERTGDVLEKFNHRKAAVRRRKAAVAAVCGCLAVVLALVLFLPYPQYRQDLSMYKDSPYFGVIQKLSDIKVRNMNARLPVNNLARLTQQFSDSVEYLTGGVKGEWAGSNMAPGDPIEMPEMDAALDSGNQKYEEVTDNQVEGVIEGDLIKRSDRYIYYLRGGSQLTVYSIAQDASDKVGVFQIPSSVSQSEKVYYISTPEMFLSADCSTVTIVRSVSYKSQTDVGTRMEVISLDVSDPANITEKGRVFIGGDYLSSRMVGGKVLVVGEYYAQEFEDFSDESQFLPQYGTAQSMQSVPAENIYCPDVAESGRYTVICQLDAATLTVEDTAAFLSYSNTLYVSESHIFATRSYNKDGAAGLTGEYTTEAMTTITCLSYGEGGLKPVGSIDIAGTVKNQYSMDAYDGILRVVTTTSHWISKEGSNGEFSWVTQRDRVTNASLYCISLADWKVVASVENFAPANESAESVRFDGTMAYVCTAEVIQMRDPVYFFDLSDLNNITWKDTGTIDGYSSSLVDFGSGNLLGIGFNDQRGLKIEIYTETDKAVESICAYEREASFAWDYKAYLIDREDQMVGLCVNDWYTGECDYVVLMFDGYKLVEIAKIPCSGDMNQMRAFEKDGWLYVLSDDFAVKNLW